jgi:hypothetical protein
VTGWKSGEEEGGECRKNRNEINRRTWGYFGNGRVHYHGDSFMGV